MPTNTAPTVANAVANQNAKQGAAFSFQFAANTFVDLDGDALTYSAQLTGGGALPTWLTFDATTRTFRGTPASGDLGTLGIDVTANDGQGGMVADSFNVTVTRDDVLVMIKAVSIPASTMKVGDVVTATITVTDDGGYPLVLGSSNIGGFALSNLARVNSTTYTAQFTVSAGGKDVPAGASIGFSLALSSNDSGLGLSGSITQAGDAINANAPTAIALSNASINTNAGAAAVVGALSSTDASSAETFTYSLVGGVGSTDNALFHIVAGQLVAKDAGALVAGTSYTVRVCTTDAGGNTFEQDFGVMAVHSVAVTGVTSSNADGAYKAGSVVRVQVHFSEAVTVTGTPQLALETGTIDRVAVYDSGSGTNTLNFIYIVQAGDTSADLDYQNSTALNLNGGTIKSGATAAGLTLPAPGVAGSLGANSDIVIDTTPPSAPSTPDLAAASDNGASTTDNITNATTPTFTGTAEAGSTVRLYDTDGFTLLGSTIATDGTWSITASTLGAGVHTITAKATDAAGNTSAPSSSLNVTIDTNTPGAPSTPVLDAASDTGASSSDRITANNTPTFTGTAEAGSTVTLYDTDGTTVLGAAIAAGGIWSIISSTLSDGEHTLTATASDVAGNVSGVSSALAVTIDTTAPLLVTAAVNGKQLVLTYNESGTLDAANAPDVGAFAVTAGGAANAVTAVAVNAVAKTVTLTLTSAVSYGQGVTVSYTDPMPGDDANTIQDAAGNDAATFAAAPVTNTTAAPPPPPPPVPAPEPVVPAPPAPVPDGNGIPAAMEDSVPGLVRPDGSAPVAGDGNGDGIKDSLQVEVASIAFVLSPTSQTNPGSAPPTFTTLVASSQDGKVSSGTSNSRITSLVQKNAPEGLPDGLKMPMGMVAFTVALAEGVSSEQFSLYVDASLGANGYWKQNSAGTWVNLASEAYGGKVALEGGRVRLDFQIEDGGAFDADGKADGVITDPGAPAFLALSIVGVAPPVPEGGLWF